MNDLTEEIPVKKTVEVKPFKCPVCNAFGTLKFGKVVCHACGGKGYVLVPQEIEVDPNRI